MAATNSTMVALGTPCPGFALPEPLTGRTISREELTSGKKGLLVMFLCNHCPFVKHVRSQVAAIGREYQSRGIGVVAISSNDVSMYPDDSPEKMAMEARDAGYTFPYLYDEDQGVARAFDAACTPDFFVFGADQALVYRGQLDDSRPGNGVPVTGRDVRAALDAVAAGRPVSPEQMPSIGCNIKWKMG